MIQNIFRFFAFFLAPTVSLAYVGPGVGLTAVGTVVALVLVLVAAVIGFIWFPLKRLLKAKKEKQHFDP